MKHEEKTLQTKKALAASLKQRMQHTALNKITVRELIEDCSINRKTFYYHFDDIYDLLHWTLAEEGVYIVKHFDLINDYEAAISFVMDYVEQNDHILNCALDSMGRDHLKQFFYNDFIDIISNLIHELEAQLDHHLNDNFRMFLSNFYPQPIAGVLPEWIRHNNERDRESTINNISLIMMESLPAIIAKA